MKLLKLDRMFSKYVRAKANWRCEWWDEHGNRCTNEFQPPTNSRGLHCSHFYGRRAMSTRFCPDNCDSLCFQHHRFVEENPAEYWRYKIEKIGVDRVEALRRRWLEHVKCNKQFKDEQEETITELLRSIGIYSDDQWMPDLQWQQEV